MRLTNLNTAMWGQCLAIPCPSIFTFEEPQLRRLFEKMVLSFHMKKRAAAFAAHSLYYAGGSNVGDAITPYQADTSVLVKASPRILLMRLFLLSKLHVRLVWDKAVVIQTHLNE